MDVTVINELNAILKGEHMAIDSYENYIQDIKEERIRKELEQIKLDHKRHYNNLADRIRSLGGTPEADTGFTGTMAHVKQTIQHMGKMNTADILKRAYDGEDRGIGMSEEVIKGDLDAESMAMVKKNLSEDHDHLKQLAKLIGKLENGEYR